MNFPMEQCAPGPHFVASEFILKFDSLSFCIVY